MNGAEALWTVKSHVIFLVGSLIRDKKIGAVLTAGFAGTAKWNVYWMAFFDDRNELLMTCCLLQLVAEHRLSARFMKKPRWTKEKESVANAREQSQCGQVRGSNRQVRTYNDDSHVVSRLKPTD